jgi:hypothetical protein
MEVNMVEQTGVEPALAKCGPRTFAIRPNFGVPEEFRNPDLGVKSSLLCL